MTSILALLFFDTPRGLRFHVSALPTLHAASSYDLGGVGLINGSLSYLYSSLPIRKASGSDKIDLHDLVQGYRHVRELQRPEDSSDFLRKGRRTNKRDTLLYGRLFLPRSALEALYLRRISPTRQLSISCVSDGSLNNGGTILALLQQDVGKHSSEFLYSTDSALLGVRGLYNLGPDPRQDRTQSVSIAEQMNGRFSIGGELYYGLLNKTVGMSTGLRFTTLPKHTGFPYTMTLTLNPLMGNLSSSYSVKAGKNLALSSQFDFNFYSYESDLRLGCELWRLREREQLDWVQRLHREGWEKPRKLEEDVTGVLKARWDQNWKIGILWEGRFKELLFSLGVSFDMQRRDQIFRAVGAELQFSS